MQGGDVSPGYVACGSSVPGARHMQKGIPCEDAWACEKASGFLVIAVADGLSSADNGGKGAAVAVHTSVTAVAGILETRDPDDTPDIGAIIRAGFAAARFAIQEDADKAGEEVSSYATTLLVTVVRDRIAWCGHIGDGACVVLSGEEVSVLSAPGLAVYANETAVLTAPRWEQDLRMNSGSADVVLLSTDGCQGALIRRENGKQIPYAPFILPLVKALSRYYTEGRDCNAEIADLLSSERMRALSSDDMTLVAGFCTPGETAR